MKKNDATKKYETGVNVHDVLTLLDNTNENYDVINDITHTNDICIRDELRLLDKEYTSCRQQRKLAETTARLIEKYNLWELKRQAYLVLGRKIHFELKLAEQMHKLLMNEVSGKRSNN